MSTATTRITSSAAAPAADWQLANRRAQDRIVRLQTQRAREATTPSAAVHSFLEGEIARPAFRVGQLDTELLDEELLGLLKGQLWNGLKYFRPSIKETYEPELLLLLRAALFKLTIWDNNASYGAALQNLRYVDARRKGPLDHPPTKMQKSLYGLVTVGGRYIHSRLNRYLLDHSNPEDSTPLTTRLSKLLDTASTLHSALTLVSFTAFLITGHYRTLLDRFLRMRLTTPDRTISREVSFEYLNRQLVWHAFTEFLLFILPLLRVTRWRRWWSRFLRRIRSDPLSADGETQGELSFLPERTCAICFKETDAETGPGMGGRQTDVTNPYEAVECGHVYCYVCIAGKIELEEGEGWTCLRCGALVKRCRPWRGDVAGLTRIGDWGEEKMRGADDSGIESGAESDSEVGSHMLETELLEDLDDDDEDESDDEEMEGEEAEVGSYRARSVRSESPRLTKEMGVEEGYASDATQGTVRTQGTARNVMNGYSSGSEKKVGEEEEEEEEEFEEEEEQTNGNQWAIDYNDESLLDDSQYNTAEDYE